MSALDTLHELSAGCTDSWELYRRTSGIDLDVTSREWGEVAESIELSAGAERILAWAAAQRSLSSWMMTVNRRLDLGPQIQRGPKTDHEVELAVTFLIEGVIGETRDVDDLGDDELRWLWASLELAVGPGNDPLDDPEHPLHRRCREAEAELSRRALLPEVLYSPSKYRGEKRVSVDVKEPWKPGDVSKVRSTSKEWVAFFREPHGILHLDFPMRLPKAVFASLEGQTELLSISMMWSDIDDLSVLRRLPNLRRLVLETGVPANDADPIGDLQNLEHLSLGSRSALTDLSALGRLVKLETLVLSHERRIDSIGFIRTMPSLKRLDLFGRVRGKDYTPLLDRPDLDWVRLRPERGMNPSVDELRHSIPGLVVYP